MYKLLYFIHLLRYRIYLVVISYVLLVTCRPHSVVTRIRCVTRDTIAGSLPAWVASEWTHASGVWFIKCLVVCKTTKLGVSVCRRYVHPLVMISDNDCSVNS